MPRKSDFLEIIGIIFNYEKFFILVFLSFNKRENQMQSSNKDKFILFKEKKNPKHSLA